VAVGVARRARAKLCTARRSERNYGDALVGWGWSGRRRGLDEDGRVEPQNFVGAGSGRAGAAQARSGRGAPRRVENDGLRNRRVASVEIARIGVLVREALIYPQSTHGSVRD